MSLQAPLPERIIQSYSLRDGVVEIQYAEGYDQSDNVAVFKVLMFNASILEDLVGELMSDMDDLVDAAIEKLRNPPLTRPGHRD